MMSLTQLTQVGFFGHGITALAYLGFALLAFVARRRTRSSGLMLALASAATCLWAAVVAYDFGSDTTIGPAGQVLELVRTCGWMVLLLGLLNWITPVHRSSWAAAIVGICTILGVLVVILGAGSTTSGLNFILIGGELALAIIGLGLVENLFRNSPRDRYWSIKYLCLGVRALFAYDFYLYADALLFRHLDGDLYVARGITNLLVVPFLAVYANRERSAGPQIAVSRRFAFYPATVMGAGLYLLLMAAAGYYVRRFGGSWSGFLQTVFFFG